ncbi:MULTISPECIES: hypothetical protein [unclassified Erwinia]|nr:MULTISPECIES: hypothetical protein [unclassified Erwinia]
MNRPPFFMRFGTLLSAPAWARAVMMLIVVLVLVLATRWAGAQ